MVDNHGKPGPVLKDKIDELESLINTRSDQRETPQSEGRPAIPILDELVSNEDYGDTGTTMRASLDPEDHRLEVLADQLEQKLSNELDEIVNILKLNLKQSIKNELHDQLKNDPHHKPGS